MIDRLSDVWATRDFPVLVTAARLLQDGESFVIEGHFLKDLEMPAEVSRKAVVALEKAGFLEARILTGDDRVMSTTVTGVTERGMREVGLWPSPEAAADRLIAALDSLIAQAPTEDDRNRWQKVRDGLVGAGRDMVVGVATAMITGQLPGQGG